MGDEDRTRRGRVRIVVDLEFFDQKAFARAVERIVEGTVQQAGATTSQVAVQCDRDRTGRAVLTQRDWQRRFEVVRRILRAKEELGIALEQACAREGIPYSTFRGWRRRMAGDEKDQK